MEHSFTLTIKELLRKEYGESGLEIFEQSLLIQYINEKNKVCK